MAEIIGSVVEFALGLLVELDVGDGGVLLEVRDRRGAGDQQHVGRDRQRPRERDLRRCAAELGCLALNGGVAEHRVVGGECRAEREERDERDAVLDAGVQHRLRRPVDKVVGVLHADDLGAVQRDLQMVESDAAQPDSADQSFVAGLDHRGQLTVEKVAVRPRPTRIRIAGVDAQVDGGEAVDVQRAQVLLDGRPQLVGLLRGQPRARCRRGGPPTLLTSARSAGYGCSASRISSLDDVRAVELRGVDVVDAQLNCAPQYRDRLVVVARRPEHAGPGELHGAEADAADGVGAKLECLHGATLKTCAA